MHSIIINDNFKIYMAETKKIGSRFIFVQHGGALSYTQDPFFNFIERISDKIITWGVKKNEQNIYNHLSPTLPTIKLKKFKEGNNCSIIFIECLKYLRRFNVGPTFEQTDNFFKEIQQFVNTLLPEIRSKVKFRVKINHGINSEKKFSEMFGNNSIDKVSYKNPFEKTIINSKLVIVTYPETAFAEAMYSNVPTILIIKKNSWPLSLESKNIFDILKKNKIAFEDFNEAKIHINEYWKKLDIWWKSKNVQSAREIFLKNFFNVKPNWYKDWSNYISFSKDL